MKMELEQSQFNSALKMTTLHPNCNRKCFILMELIQIVVLCPFKEYGSLGQFPAAICW